MPITNADKRNLLMMMWQMNALPDGLSIVGGERFELCFAGERDHAKSVFRGVEVRVDGVVRRGSVQFLPVDERFPMPDDVVLCVSMTRDELKLGYDGERIPVLVVEPPEEAVRRYEVMISQRTPYDCGYYISQLGSCKRLDLFTHLYLERLRAKSDEVAEWFQKLDKDWNRTLYLMLMRTFGESKNKDAYTILAGRVPVEAINRERDSVISLEALLLGASGLLDAQPDDKYTFVLKETFEHFSRKYSIRKMNVANWSRDGVREYNQPVNRLATIAMLLHSKPFMFDSVMKCRTKEDLHRLFCVEASEYWSSRTSANNRIENDPKRIGSRKAELLGINFVAVMQFAYGQYLNDEQQKAGVVDLIERIPVESNSIIAGWSGAEVKMDNAFDGQAVLQLHKVYCTTRRCSECPIGKKIIKDTIYIGNC